MSRERAGRGGGALLPCPCLTCPLFFPCSHCLPLCPCRWEKYVYLRGRSSICINSNYYVLDSGRWTPTKNQEARAAALLYLVLRYREQLDKETIEPLMVGNNAVPLCMWQFERMFSTSRLPGRECDENKHWDSSVSKHVCVYYRGSYYKLNMYKKDGSLRKPMELQGIIAAIKKDAIGRQKKVGEAEASIAALTAEDRTRWAEVRETQFCDGVNRSSLHAVESAVLFLALSDKSYEENKETVEWTDRGKYLLGGDTDMPNTWFDKSINMIVFADGKTGLNCEHSWADAPVPAHLFEVAMIAGEDNLKPYDETTGAIRADLFADGQGRGSAFGPSPANSTSGSSSSGADETGSWSRLVWSLSSEAEDSILTAKKNLCSLVNDLDLRVVAFKDYGKDFIKTCKVSPDAYLQMAMQLAYFRDQGHFDATYESSMTRLFLHGRTETVRPVTKESCAFVHTMTDSKADAKAKLKALQDAAKRHVLGYTDAMCGKGIDRHLFALYVVSVGKNIDSPFLKSALSVPWKLSTSQQPQQQTTLWDIKDLKNQRRISPGGGFGPVADEGYGVSYMVSGERELFFHVSSKKSAANTDSSRFAGKIAQALRDMKAILETATDNGAKKEKPAAGGAAGAQ